MTIHRILRPGEGIKNEVDKRMNICKTCKHWNFKLGGSPSGLEWGECKNPRYYEYTRISDRLVDYGKVADINDAAHYRLISSYVKSGIRIQHEESTFGCIYHEVKE